MIIITLAGNSSRFFKSNYTTVKYKLPLGDSCVLEEIFKYLPKEEFLVIAINKKFEDKIWIENLLNKMQFKNYEVHEISDTRGQLETAKIAIDLISNKVDCNSSVTIFNGDTIRKNYFWKSFVGDGFIEVFKAKGNHWSFVDKLGVVNLVKEKERISEFCSSGLYYFRSALILLSNYDEYKSKINDELYVAPFYDFLIKKGYKVYSGEVKISDFHFCGTPEEYEITKLGYDSIF